MLDLLIANGTVVDGTGNPAYPGNVGVKDGRIASIDRRPLTAKRVIDARGMMVAPGFIDPHSHSDWVFFRDPRPDFKLRQGVTTEIVGNCGDSAAPMIGGFRDLHDSWVTATIEALGEYEGFGEYLEKVERHGLINHQAIHVGHKPIRVAVMGMDTRPPTQRELEEMQALLGDALDQGAAGFSTGLLYAPMSFATSDELIALCRVVARRGKLFSIHMRDIGGGLFESLRETLDVAQASGVALHISHQIIMGKANWGRAHEVLETLELARQRGLDITYDQTPWTAGQTFLHALLPPWMHEGGLDRLLSRLRDRDTRTRARRDMEEGIVGWQSLVRETGWDRMFILSDRLPKLREKSIQEQAELQASEPSDLAFDTIAADSDSMVIGHWTSPDDMRIFAHDPYQMVSSDSVEPGSRAHPRAYANYPRFLQMFVREEKRMRFEEAVRRMTSFAAARFGLWDRGLILPGLQADLVVFNPQTIGSAADYGTPDVYATGIEYITLAGTVVVEHGGFNGSLQGRVARLC